jgi:hypothetical protein
LTSDDLEYDLNRLVWSRRVQRCITYASMTSGIYSSTFGIVKPQWVDFRLWPTRGEGIILGVGNIHSKYGVSDARGSGGMTIRIQKFEKYYHEISSSYRSSGCGLHMGML